jgi:ectoine hydroxylase-related dioxygenase (phytanoyl-CoA dioxygenase family)
MLTTEQTEHYREHGYTIVRGLLGPDEVASFRDRARRDLRGEAAAGEMMEKGDKAGNKTLLKMWDHAADDMYGYMARDERLVSIARGLLDTDTYLYSHKMTVKEPFQGGAWEWHQDYGYWYQNKCLAPQMLSIWISLDRSVTENGCLQILPGSQALGRVDHSRIDGQTIADEEYLEAALTRFDLMHAETEPGDALIFHCNLLHRSDANGSSMPRWGYIASYNAVANAPFRNVRDYGRYEQLVPVAAGTFVAAATL